MKVIAHHRVTTDLDREDGRELAQPIADPVFAVIVVLAGDRIIPTQERSADAPVNAVVNADMVRVDNFPAGEGGHGGSPWHVSGR